MPPTPASSLAGGSPAQPGVPRELGVPVRGVNWVRLHAGATAEGRPSLLATMGQNNGGCFVLDIDVETGHCRKFAAGLTTAEFPTAAQRSLRTGILYLGSAWAGHLHRYDPARPERGLEDLGPIDPGRITFPCGIQEAPDGSLYLGGYPGCTLTRYDPANGTWTRFGPLDDIDKYLYPLVGDDGTVAAQVKMTRYFVVALDPATGERRRVGPLIEAPTARPHRFRFYLGDDGLLYLDTETGGFRLRGLEAVPVDRLPPPRPGIHATDRHDYQAPVVMPGGSTARFVEGSGLPHRTVRLRRADGATRDLALDWTGDGTSLFLIHAGPDGLLYGSSYLPEHLFRCAPDGSGMTDLGPCSRSLGEAYSMANYDGKLAIASYPAARLSLYDPALPWRFGTGPGSNPLDVGSLDPGPVGYRPHALLAGRDGRLWMGSAPHYGLRGGTLAWFDPVTADRRSHHPVVPDLSPFCLLWLGEPDRILVGLGTAPGSGAMVNRDQGVFALWDPKDDRLLEAGDFGATDLADLCSLAPAQGRRVWALSARPTFLVEHHGARPAPRQILLIDPDERRVVAAAPLPEEFGPLPEFSTDVLRARPDGGAYGVTAHGVFAVGPEDPTPRWVWRNPGPPLNVAGPLLGDDLYYALGWRLGVVTLPASGAAEPR